MFGTDLLPVSFTISVIEFIFLIIQIVIYFSRKEKLRLQLIILICFYILYNVTSGLMPNSDIPIPLVLQIVLSYASGIALASYFFYYLAKKLQIYQIKKFNPKLLFASLILFFIVSFGGVYLVTKDINLSKTVFLIAASIVAVYFCVRTIYYLIKQVKNHTKDTLPTKSMIITGNLAIIFMTTMPFIAHFENVQELNHTLVNISLFLIIYASLKHFFYQSQKDNKLLEEFKKNKNSKYTEENILKNYHLSESEVKVALLLLQNLPYSKIGEKLHVAPGTASKHASNIYKKIGCKDVKSFLKTIKEQKK